MKPRTLIEKRKDSLTHLDPKLEKKISGPRVNCFDDSFINLTIIASQIRGIRFQKEGMGKFEYVPATCCTVYSKTSDALKDESLFNPSGKNPAYDIIFMDRQHGKENLLAREHASTATSATIARLLPKAPIASSGEEFTRLLRQIPGNKNVIVQLYSSDADFEKPEDRITELAAFNKPTHLFDGITYKGKKPTIDDIVKALNEHKDKPNGWTAISNSDLLKLKATRKKVPKTLSLPSITNKEIGLPSPDSNSDSSVSSASSDSSAQSFGLSRGTSDGGLAKLSSSLSLASPFSPGQLITPTPTPSSTSTNSDPFGLELISPTKKLSSSPFDVPSDYAGSKAITFKTKPTINLQEPSIVKEMARRFTAK